MSSFGIVTILRAEPHGVTLSASHLGSWRHERDRATVIHSHSLRETHRMTFENGKHLASKCHSLWFVAVQSLLTKHRSLWIQLKLNWNHTNPRKKHLSNLTENNLCRSVECCTPAAWQSRSRPMRLRSFTKMGPQGRACWQCWMDFRMPPVQFYKDLDERIATSCEQNANEVVPTCLSQLWRLNFWNESSSNHSFWPTHNM